MDNAQFNLLLAENKIGELLAEGGTNLTKAQLAKVKERSKELSDIKLDEVQRNADILAGYRVARGAQMSDVMRSYPEMLEQKFEPKRISKAMNGKSKVKGKTDDKMQEEPEQEEKYDKRKDPNISKVAPNTHSKLKKGDSEADILAKMLNMMTENYDKKHKSQLEENRLRKLEDEQATVRHEKLLAAFGYKREEPKKEKKVEDYSWLKIAGLAGLAGLGVLGMSKAFEELKEQFKNYKLPSLADIQDKLHNIIPQKPVYTTDIGKLFDALKSKEAVAGGEVTPELVEAMKKVQEMHPEIVINALNDAYHQHKHPMGDDVHTKGRAADFKIAEMSEKKAKQIQKELEDAGIKAQVMYEAPTGEGTANPHGHMHLQVPKAPDLKPAEQPQAPPPEPQKTQQATAQTPPATETNTPPAPAPLKLVPKSPVLADTDVKVKDMQDIKGRATKPKTVIIKQDTVNVYNNVNVKQGIDTVNERNWKENKEIPLQVLKQTGLNLNMLQY